MLGINAAFWWTLAGVLIMICEFVMPGLILFFFGVGALITALLTAFLPLSLTWQLSVFLISSLVSLFALRRFLKQIFTGRKVDEIENGDMVDGLAGSEGVVRDAIAPGMPGKIILNGVAWKAEADEALEVDALVTVVSQKSLTLVVKSK